MLGVMTWVTSLALPALLPTLDRGHLAGLVLLAAAPSGPLSVAYTRLVDGDVRLAMRLVVASTVASPVAAMLAVSTLGDQDGDPAALWRVAIHTVLLVVLPFATGLVTARRWPALGKRLARLATPMTLAVLAGAVAITVMGAPLRRLLTSAPPLVLATVGLNATNLLAGYLTGGLAPGVALSFSVRNGTVAMAVAAGPAFSSMPTALASIVVYAGIQSLTSAALIGTIKRRSARQAVT